MENKKRLSVLFCALLAVIVVLLPSVIVYARYQSSFSDVFSFQAKPAHALTLTQQQWQQTGQTHTLTFSLQHAAEDCRVYLAVSQGVTAPEALTVTLTLPDASAQTLTATPSPIAEGSALHTLFGDGYVFRFTQGQPPAETVMDLSTQPYRLTVQGLDEAVQVTSLLRLFIEYV